MSEVNNLLPCPFCGGTNLRLVLRHFQWCVDCVDCNIQGPSCHMSNKDLCVQHWNTRSVGGNVVTFHWEKAGVISKNPCWVAMAGGYMYGACDTWQEVEKVVRDEWKMDKNLAM